MKADDRWFLSLYINSMPLIFAFRIVDCVLAMGVKVLFQIGLGEWRSTSLSRNSSSQLY